MGRPKGVKNKVAEVVSETIEEVTKQVPRVPMTREEVLAAKLAAKNK